MKRLAIALALALAAMGPAAAKPTHHHVVHTASYAYEGDDYYTNVNGHQVRRPVAGARPAGATAHCRDGSWSFSENHRGTCSHHGGVSQWL